MKTQATKWISFLISFFILLGLPQSALCSAKQNKVQATKKVEKVLQKTEEALDREKIKEKFHEVAEGLDVEKIDEKVDQVVSYFDAEKLKEQVDYIADAFDREKIKDFIDLAADYLDRDKIKHGIDLIAESIDREKIKDFIHQVAANIDKEQIKEKFDQSVDRIADSFESAISSVSKEIQATGGNHSSAKELLRKYTWNRWIPDRVSSGPATLSGLKLGGGGR